VLDFNGKPATAIGVQLEGGSVDTTGWGYTAADGTFYIIHKNGTFTLNVFLLENYGWRFIGRYGGESGLTTDRAQASLIRIDGADVTGIEIRLPADLAATPSAAPTYPEIVFVGEISPEYQAATRAAIEKVVAYYADRFGVQAPTFSMFVGADPEAVQTVLLEYGGVGTVIPSGGQVMRLAGEMDALLIVGHSVVTGTVNSTLLSHEYFHVLQRALANVSANSNFDRTPNWLIEGSATYEGILSQGFWSSSYRDGAIVRTANFDGRLRDLDRYNPLVGYGPGAIAVEWLAQLAGERSQVDYWRLLATSTTWQDAFASAFGMTVDEFHEAFEEHRWTLLAELAAGRVRGTVLGPDGLALEGTGLSIGREGALDGSRGETDRDGAFDVHVLAGALTIRMYIQEAGLWRHVGWYGGDHGFTADVGQRTVLEVQDGDVIDVQIRLPANPADLPEARIPSVRGTVLGHDGTPVEGVALWLRDESSDGNRFVGVSSDGTFDALALYRDGTFTLGVYTWRDDVWHQIGWYGGETGFTTDREEATVIEVAGEDVTGIEVHVPVDFTSLPTIFF